MSDKIIDKLYNPSSLSSFPSFHETNRDVQRNPSELKTYSFNESQARAILKDISSHPERRSKIVYEQLIMLKRQLLDVIPMSTRFSFLQDLNSVFITLTNTRTHEMDLFQACIQIMTLMKEQIECRPLSQKLDAEKEWVELERSAYLLTKWEEKLNETWSENRLSLS